MRFLFAVLAAATAMHPQERCGTAQDLVVRALEAVAGPGGDARVGDGLQLVKQAAEECAGLGDAWYYRSVFEQRLGHKNLVKYALDKARLLGSEAMEEGADPFHLAVPTDQHPSRVVHDKYAVVIGIGKFMSPFAPRLRFARKDAQDIAGVLTDPQYGHFSAAHVHLITDQDATTVRIKSELNWLARTAEPDDLALIFIASHGSSRDQDIAEANYVVTYDTDARNPDQLYATALPMIEIAEVVRTRMKARRAAVFLDTCHSEGALANLRLSSPSKDMMKKMDEGSGRVIITSSQVNQQSYESDKIGNGYFTHFLVEALRQANGQATIGALFEYVKQHVSQAVKSDAAADQVPVISRSDPGAEQIIIGVAPGASARLLRLLKPTGFPAVLF